MPNFGTKNVLFEHFWDGILRNYCHIWNQGPRICLIVKFHAKIKILKFGTRNAYLGVLGSNFEKLLSHLKLAPSNLSYCKVWWKNKNP